ncbi:MATE family efflux transporter [Vibrio sinaloensis]|nr:MATE family efflux transporter [Vibrio sinaloensis]
MSVCLWALLRVSLQRWEKALGEDNQRKAQSLTTFSVLLFSGVTCLLGLVGYALMPSTFALLGANASTSELIGQYMGPLYLGMFFLLVGGLIANSALMAKGIMVQTTLVMALGGVTNVLFDYLLIFGKGPFPELGLMGGGAGNFDLLAGDLSADAGVTAQTRFALTAFHVQYQCPN